MPDLASDEVLLRRFLLDEVSGEERERIEEHFLVDQEYFEVLCAVENDLILGHIRGELPDEEEAQFRAVILTAPARRRQVDEMRLVVAAAEAVNEPWWRWQRKGFLLLLSTAAAVLVLTVGLVIRREQPSIVEEPAVASVSTRAVTPATFLLLPSDRLAGGNTVNELIIPTGTEDVELRMLVPVEPGSRLTAELRRSDRDRTLMPINAEPVLRDTSSGSEVTWVIPASSIPPGSYELALNAETDGRDKQNIANRSFTTATAR